jgi:hypothetical protein
LERRGILPLKIKRETELFIEFAPKAHCIE